MFFLFIDDLYANRHPPGWDQAAESQRQEAIQQQIKKNEKLAAIAAEAAAAEAAAAAAAPVKPPSSKRTSVFQLRSRSNTVTSQASTAGSGASPAPKHLSTRSDDSSRRSSSNDGTSISDAPSSNDGLDASGKPLLYGNAVGRKLKKTTKRPPSSSGIMLDKEKEAAGSKFRGVWNNLHGKEIKIPGTEPNRRTMISGPSDFQHLVHTNRDDLSVLFQIQGQTGASTSPPRPPRETPRTRGLDLQTDMPPVIESPSFSPSGLSIIGRTLTNDSACSNFDPPSWNRKSRSVSGPAPQPAMAPGRGFSQSRGSGAPPVRPIRSVRSIDSFQFAPVASLPDAPPSQSPLPRRSSRRGWAPRHIINELNNEPGSPRAPLPADEYPSPSGSDVPQSYEEEPLPPLPNLPAEQHSERRSPESTLSPIPPSFPTELESLKEEPEGISSRRASRTSADRNAFGSTLRHSRSLPGSHLIPVKSNESTSSEVAHFPPHPHSLNQSRARPMSQMSDTLGSVASPPRPPTRRPSQLSRKMSVRSRPSDTPLPESQSWEDVIDMVYEKGGEAHCDFDWDLLDEIDDVDLDGSPAYSDQTAESIREPEPGPADSSSRPRIPAKNALRQRIFELPLRQTAIPSPDSVPELDQRSAISTSTASVGALTPLDQSYQFPPIPSVPNKDTRRRSPLIEGFHQSQSSVSSGSDRNPFATSIDPYSSPFYAAPTSHPAEESTNPAQNRAGSATTAPGCNAPPVPPRARHSRYSSIDSTYLRDSATHLDAIHELRRSNSTSGNPSSSHGRSNSRPHPLDLGVPDASTTALTVDSIVAQLRSDAMRHSGSGPGTPEADHALTFQPPPPIVSRGDLHPQKSEELLIQVPTPPEGCRKASYGFVRSAAASPPLDAQASAVLPTPRANRSYSSRGHADGYPLSPFPRPTTATTTFPRPALPSPRSTESANFSPFPSVSATVSPPPPIPVGRPSTSSELPNGGRHKKTVSESSVGARSTTTIGKRRGFGHHAVVGTGAGEKKKKKSSYMLAAAFGMPVTSPSLRNVQTAGT